MIKDVLINFIASLLFAILTLVVGCVLLDREPNFQEVIAAFVGVLFLASLLVTLRFNMMRNAYVAAQGFDYKFFADARNDPQGNLKALYQTYGRSGFEDVAVFPEVVSARRSDGSANAEYFSAAQFFSKSNSLIDSFSCKSIRNGKKGGKVFLQLSYVPVDRNGNTILLKRLPQFHPGDFGRGSSAKLSLVSFSPIPPKYHSENFDPAQSYHNEVPVPWGRMAGRRLEFEELGSVICRDANKDAVYLFYVFKVQYNDVDFTDGKDGTLRELFYEDDAAFRRNCAFVKDHDSICAITSLSRIRQFVVTNQLPTTNAGFLTKEWRENVKLCRILRRIKIKAVESKVFESLIHM